MLFVTPLSQIMDTMQNEKKIIQYIKTTYHFIEGINLYNVDNTFPNIILLNTRNDDGSSKKPEAIRSIPTSSFSSKTGPSSRKKHHERKVYYTVFQNNV